MAKVPSALAIAAVLSLVLRPGSAAAEQVGVNSAVTPPPRVQGAFYGPRAAETGGNFYWHNPAGTYLTSGIFAAAKQ